ncbi:MAG: hypothetical protein R3E82_09615 [Pseudomonadales bacterium]|nr:hypothetical protein [Pseudomonadales bacterium]
MQTLIHTATGTRSTQLLDRLLRVLLVALITLSIPACSLKPIERSDLSAQRVAGVREALAEMRRDERLAAFFAEAEVIALYPSSARAGSAFGGAYGRGLVFDKAGTVIAHTRMWQLSVGAQLGGQVYRQILFFRTQEAYTRFLSVPSEFAGQANLALATLGIASTPSFDTEIALFTQLRGGLLLEATVGAHAYDFAPIEDRKGASD